MVSWMILANVTSLNVYTGDLLKRTSLNFRRAHAASRPEIDDQECSRFVAALANAQLLYQPLDHQVLEALKSKRQATWMIGYVQLCCRQCTYNQAAWLLLKCWDKLSKAARPVGI
jgi:hypothetical protein